jgi:hypothetical protein
MGVDTKGFVLTGCKDVMLVCATAAAALDKLILDERKVMYPTRVSYLSSEARDSFRTTSLRLAPDTELVDLEFVFKGERRCLKIFFTCDCDHKEYGPRSLSLSLKCWGESELFVMTVLHSLSILGPVFFDANDSDCVDPAPLQESRINVLKGMKMGYIPHTHLDRWLTAWDNGLYTEGMTPEQFFGMSEAQARELAGRTDFKSAWDELEQLAAMQVVAPSFMEEFHQRAAAAEAEAMT